MKVSHLPVCWFSLCNSANFVNLLLITEDLLRQNTVLCREIGYKTGYDIVPGFQGLSQNEEPRKMHNALELMPGKKAVSGT